MSTFAALFGSALASGNVQACGHNGRVVYSQPSHVVYSTPVVHSTSVVQSSPVYRTSTVVSKPIVVTTVEKHEIVEVVESRIEIQQRSVVRARVRFAGGTAGEVTIQAGGLEMQCEITEWSANQVAFRLPQIDIVADADITLKIFSATGLPLRTVKAVLTPPVDFELEPPATTIVQNNAVDAPAR